MTDIPNELFQNFGAAAGYTFPLPVLTVDPDATPLVYVRMNREWLAYVIAACMPLTLLETWRETDASTLAQVIQRAHLLIDMLMTLLCDPLCVGGLRLAGDTLQYSPDGGATWDNIDNAGIQGNPQDPRQYEPLNPARTGENIPCLASANTTACILELHREMVDWYNNSQSLITVLGMMAVILSVLFPVSAAVLLQSFLSVPDYVTALLAHSSALTVASFTTAIQNELTCIFYRHVGVDGRYDASGLAAILVEVNSHSEDMWKLIGIYLGVPGVNGLSNAATTTSVASHNCDTCGAWCYQFDLSESLFDWYIIAYGQFVLGQGVESTLAGGVAQAINLFYDTPAVSDGHYTGIEADVISTLTAGNFGAAFDALGNLWPDTTPVTKTYANHTLTHSSANTMVLNPSGTPGDHLVTIVRVRFYGTGTCPFGTPNC